MYVALSSTTHLCLSSSPPLCLFFLLSVYCFIDFLCLHTQPGYMHTLASELTNESSAVFVRNAAGLALKNALTVRVHRAFSLPLSPFPVIIPLPFIS